MQRWWIAVVALVGVGLAFFLFPRPDRGASPSDGEGAPIEAAGSTKAKVSADEAPSFGSAAKVERGQRKSQPVSVEVVEARERLAELRARPDAQASAKLIGAWGGVRKTLMESESDAAHDYAERLRQPLQDLAEYRRNPERGVPFDQIRADLDAIHGEIAASEFAGEGWVPGGLERHTEVMAELDAKTQANENEEAP